jgi:L-fuculose-phosphate aldolase
MRTDNPTKHEQPRGGYAADDPRFLVAAARRILARNGCESTVAGHVSMRAADGESFWTSPFEYFDESLPSTILRSNFDLEIVDGVGTPSPAIEFHAALYRGRSDIHAVIHIHSHWVSVISSVGTPIGMYNVGSVIFDQNQALMEDDGTRPPVEGWRVVETLGGRAVLLLKNHGAIIVGSTIEAATVLAVMLERAAHYHADCVAAGGSPIHQAEVDRGKKSYNRYVVPEMWAAMFRRLRHSDPDLMDLLLDRSGQ